MLTSPDMNGELWKTRHSRVGLQCHTTERQSLAAEARIYTESHTYTIHDFVTRSRSHTDTDMHSGTRHDTYRTREECTSTRTTSAIQFEPREPLLLENQNLVSPSQEYMSSHARTIADTGPEVNITTVWTIWRELGTSHYNTLRTKHRKFHCHFINQSAAQAS